MSESPEDRKIRERPLTSRSSKEKLSSLNGGGSIKTIVISFIVTSVILLMVASTGGMGFVTKKDFTANMVGVVATLERAKVDLVKAQNDVATAVQGIPDIITNQLNSLATQDTSQWSNQISLLLDRVSSFDESIQVLEAGIESANLEIVTLTNQVDGLEVAVEELEDRLTEPVTLTEGITTIWTLSAYTNTPSIGVDTHSYPYRIEEEGDYGITFDLSNITDTTISDVIATITFTPRRNDRITVDERDVYLYSYGSSIRWDVVVDVRSDGTCRRITFVSERFDVPSTDLSLEMDFTLEY